jgi:hypothetical protein
VGLKIMLHLYSHEQSTRRSRFSRFDDVVLTPLDDDFVRSLMQSRAASIQIKDYNSPDPDRINLEDAAKKLRWALNKCFKF